jgi:hypothetical protein
MRDKPELKQDANGTWYVDGNVGYVKGNVLGYVWGSVGWIRGDVGSVWGDVRDNVVGTVKGTINSLKWQFAEENNDE